MFLLNVVTYCSIYKCRWPLIHFINPFLVNFLFLYWLEHSVLILFASMHQIKIVSWNYVITVTCDSEHEKNNIITHSPSAVYFSSIRCSRENALSLWLPIISVQLESRIVFRLDRVFIVSPVFFPCSGSFLNTYDFKDQIKDTCTCTRQ